MESLPDEILLEVFSRCRLSAVFHAQFVNRKWFALAWKSRTHLDFFSSSKFNGPRIYLTHFIHPSYSPERLKEGGRFLLSKIKWVFFERTNSTLQALLFNYCPNLEYMNMPEFFGVPDDALRSVTSLRRLEFSSEYNPPSFFDDGFLDRLDHFSFTFHPNPVINDVDDSQNFRASFLDAIYKATQLRNLKLIGPQYAFPRHFPSYLSKLSNLLSLELGELDADLINEVLKLSFPSLKHLVLRADPSYSSKPMLAVITHAQYPFLESLGLYGRFDYASSTSGDKGFLDDILLKKLTIDSDESSLDKFRFLSTQARTLEELELILAEATIRSDTPTSLLSDLATFEKLRKLKLSLGFHKDVSQSILEPVITRTPQLQKLDLTIKREHISSKLFTAIASVGARLRSLGLSRFILSNETLKCLLSLTELRSLKLKYKTLSKNFAAATMKDVLASLDNLVEFELACSRKRRNRSSKDTFDPESLLAILSSCKNLDRVRLDGVLSRSISLRTFHAACPFISQVELRE